jgi:hypothetical protein
MQKTAQQAQMLKMLTSVYEEKMNAADYRDVLAFALVLSLINENQKKPNEVLDRILHYWVKTVSVLAQSPFGFSGGDA